MSLKSVFAHRLAKKPSKQIAGLKAKRNGDGFENLIINKFKSCGVAIKKIHTGTQFIGAGKTIPKKNLFDFISAYKGKTVFFDAKVRGDKTFPYSKVNQNQLDDLLLFEAQGINCGYVVGFEGGKRIVFFSASQLKKLTHGKSYSEIDGVFLSDDIFLDSFAIKRLYK